MEPCTAEKTVDLIFASPAPTIKIEFQGGEPTLNWPIIELIVNRAEKLNEKKKKNLGFVLCSNLLRAEKNGSSSAAHIRSPYPPHWTVHRICTTCTAKAATVGAAMSASGKT